jgi:hypothetical protein
VTTRLPGAIVVAIVVATGSANGQAKKAIPKRAAVANCATPAESAPWVKAQRDLLAESATKWSNDTLREAIRTAVSSQWSDSPSLQLGWMIADSATPMKDSAATTMVMRLRNLGRGAAGPSRSNVGAAGMRGVFLLANSDTALLRSMLHRVMEAGPEEGIKPDIAVMEDRVRLMSGRKQLYGTQFHLVGASIKPFAIEDSAHVDLRRDSADLPPFAWSVCNARHALAK